MKIGKCENCEYFMQHYIKLSRFGISKVSCGHCTLKQKKVKTCTMFKNLLGPNDNEFTILNLALSYERKLSELLYEIGRLTTSISNFKKYIISSFQVEGKAKEKEQ